jgi:DNA primase
MLRNQDADFDEIVSEIAAQSESDVDYARLELAGAVRQTTMKMLKAEQEQLAAEGLASESARLRYREINSQMDRLRALAEKEAAS